MTEYRYKDFESEYLCPFCGNLIYNDVSRPTKDICINPHCELWPREFTSILNATEKEEPRLFNDLRKMENLLISEIAKWKPGYLARYSYNVRKSLITEFLTKGIMPRPDLFIAIGDLLSMLNKYPSNGNIGDFGLFHLIENDILLLSRDKRNLEDIQNKRFIFAKTNSNLHPLSVKYYKAITKFHNEIGIVNNTVPSSNEGMFPYTHLEQAATPKVDIAEISDYEQMLNLFWPMSLQLRYFLQEHFITKLEYNYTPDVLDFTVLIGWLITTWKKKGQLLKIPAENFEKEDKELQAHFDSQAIGKYSSKKFFESYVDNTYLVPVVVRTPEGILMDCYTLLFFLIYLEGCKNPEEPAIKKREDITQEMRAKVGIQFENWLRNEIKNNGYSGPPSSVIFKGYEYDIMAISEEKKIIILADAKYRDMSPSSFTGDNLIQQEILGTDKLQDESVRQQSRLEYFRNNSELFRDHLKPKLSWGDYTIQSYLLTKQIPLAHRYREVRILQASEFLKILI